MINQQAFLINKAHAMGDDPIETRKNQSDAKLCEGEDMDNYTMSGGWGPTVLQISHRDDITLAGNTTVPSTDLVDALE